MPYTSNGIAAKMKLFFADPRQRGKEYTLRQLGYRFKCTPAIAGTVLRQMGKEGWDVKRSNDQGTAYYQVDPPQQY